MLRFYSLSDVVEYRLLESIVLCGLYFYRNEGSSNGGFSRVFFFLMITESSVIYFPLSEMKCADVSLTLFFNDSPRLFLMCGFLKTEGSFESLSGYIILGVRDLRTLLPKLSLSMDSLEISTNFRSIC